MLERYFGLAARGTTVGTEVRAGLTTFVVMSYIIVLNAVILTTGAQIAKQDLPFTAVVTATCLVAGLMTLAMGLYANFPLAIAPGMGLNSVVAFHLMAGQGLPWQAAMMAAVGRELPWHSIDEGLPALLTLTIMPLTWSITNGIGAGAIVYTFIKLIRGQVDDLHPLMLIVSAAFVAYFLSSAA